MYKYTKRELITDDFGNMYFQNITCYEFDYYIFEHIKSFLLKKKPKTAIICLNARKKKHILNKNNKFLKVPENMKPITELNKPVKILPSLFNINFEVDKLFVTTYQVDNLTICRVHDMKPVKICHFYSQEIINNINNDLLGTTIHKKHRYLEYEKQEKIVGEFYLDNKLNNLITYTDKNIICYIEKNTIDNNIIHNINDIKLQDNSIIKYSGGYLSQRYINH